MASEEGRKSANRLLRRMFALYLAILTLVGLIVGLLTQSVLLGLVGVVVAVCVLPFIATGLRVRHERKQSAAAR